jgi:hypothetical protein
MDHGGGDSQRESEKISGEDGDCRFDERMTAIF